MKSYFCLIIAIAISLLSLVPQSLAEGNAKRGGKIYRACAACHSLEKDLHLTGPSLANLWGKKSASIKSFLRYSKALKTTDFVWDETTLNAWLADPSAFIPENYMTFRGIRDEKVREDLIEFLRLALPTGGLKSVISKGLISANIARGQVPEDLNKVDPNRQITKIRHCKNTYYVTTADGSEILFWETNFRIKTDSSKRGPQSGNPVIAGSGMQGDRVSIIFSNPVQISKTIESKC